MEAASNSLLTKLLAFFTFKFWPTKSMAFVPISVGPLRISLQDCLSPNLFSIPAVKRQMVMVLNSLFTKHTGEILLNKGSNSVLGGQLLVDS